MNTLIKKIGLMLIITLMLVFILNTYAMAMDPSAIVDSLDANANNAVANDVAGIGGSIISIITTVGVVVAVVVLLILGIKYMMGSASEKAEYKKTMIPYLVGAILIFGASAITKVVISLSSNITA